MAAPAPYGSDHQRRRELGIEGAYNTPCPRCGRLMLRGQKLHFGHTQDKALYHGSKADRFEHADYEDCPQGGNTAAGGRLAATLRDLQPSEKWW